VVAQPTVSVNKAITLINLNETIFFIYLVLSSFAVVLIWVYRKEFALAFRIPFASKRRAVP
jgi:hypothetical protein